MLIYGSDAAGARKLLGAEDNKIPAKYWKAISAIKNPEKRGEEDTLELDAPAIIYGATSIERGYQDYQRRGGARVSYAHLLEDYADTAFVRRHRTLLEAWTGPAEEIIFGGDDLSSEGDFRISVDDEKVGPAWKLSTEPVGAGVLENFVTFTFTPAAEGTTRCWLFVGACCREAGQM